MMLENTRPALSQMPRRQLNTKKYKLATIPAPNALCLERAARANTNPAKIALLTVACPPSSLARYIARMESIAASMSTRAISNHCPVRTNVEAKIPTDRKPAKVLPEYFLTARNRIPPHPSDDNT